MKGFRIVTSLALLIMIASGFVLSAKKASRTMFPRAINTRMLSASATPNNENPKAFYALGVSIARQIGKDLKGLLTKDEIGSVLSGFSDSMLDKTSNEQAMLSEFGPALNAIITNRSSRRAEFEKKNGEEFRAKYLLSNADAVQTQSGLIINEIVAGTGAQPTLQSTVNVHYHGTLIDGTVFDSSVQRGEPIQFPLTNVIRGWQEGVALMQVGGKATLVVPSDLAYGDEGSPPAIPPGATLIFEVELLSVE